MKEKSLPIVFFVCMGILLAFLYGIVELGGLGMEIWEKVIVSIIIGGSCMYFVLAAFVLLLMVSVSFVLKGKVSILVGFAEIGRAHV